MIFISLSENEKMATQEIYNKQSVVRIRIRSDPDDRYNRPPQDRDPGEGRELNNISSEQKIKM